MQERMQRLGYRDFIEFMLEDLATGEFEMDGISQEKAKELLEKYRRGEQIDLSWLNPQENKKENQQEK